VTPARRRRAPVTEGASARTRSLQLYRRRDSDLVTNVMRSLQGVTSTLGMINLEAVRDDPRVPQWRHEMSEAIGQLRKFNKRLWEEGASVCPHDSTTNTLSKAPVS